MLKDLSHEQCLIAQHQLRCVLAVQIDPYALLDVLLLNNPHSGPERVEFGPLLFDELIGEESPRSYDEGPLRFVEWFALKAKALQFAFQLAVLGTKVDPIVV